MSKKYTAVWNMKISRTNPRAETPDLPPDLAPVPRLRAYALPPFFRRCSASSLSTVSPGYLACQQLWVAHAVELHLFLRDYFGLQLLISCSPHIDLSVHAG